VQLGNGSAKAIFRTGLRSTAAPGTTADEADLIFFGGPVLTSNDKAPRAEAVAVTRGIISAVGRASDVMAQKGSRTQLVELKGHALTPGFVDAHMHTAITIQDPWLDIGPMTTKDVDEAIAKLKATAAKTPPGEWILCKLFDPSLMPGQPITMQLLDSVAPNNPVWVLESNGHIAYGNSKAFAAAGVTDKCADFAVLEKDPTAVDSTTIKSIKVVETWLDGYKRHAV